MKSKVSIISVILAFSFALTLVGCSEPGEKLVGGDATLIADESSAAFLDRISSQTKVNQNDALRGMLFLLDGDDKATTFSDRIEALASRGIVDAKWNMDASRPITKGKLAYMVYQAGKVPGGVILTLAGPSERYCLRELQFQRIMSQGSVYSSVTGMEYVAVLMRADTYIQTGQVDIITTGGQ